MKALVLFVRSRCFSSFLSTSQVCLLTTASSLPNTEYNQLLLLIFHHFFMQHAFSSPGHFLALTEQNWKLLAAFGSVCVCVCTCVVAVAPGSTTPKWEKEEEEKHQTLFWRRVLPWPICHSWLCCIHG